MIGWGILAFWLLGIVVLWRRWYGAIERHERSSLDDAVDRGMYGFFAFIGACLWPVVLIGYAVVRAGYFTTAETRAAARAQRIKELEREVGLR